MWWNRSVQMRTGLCNATNPRRLSSPVAELSRSVAGAEQSRAQRYRKAKYELQTGKEKRMRNKIK